MAERSLLERVRAQGGVKGYDYLEGMRRAAAELPDSLLCFSHGSIAGPGRAHHHRFVILQNYADPGVVCLDDLMFPFSEGDMIIFFPFQYHNYLSVADSTSWLFITFELTNYEHLEPLRNRVLRTSPRIQSLTATFLDDYNKPRRRKGRRVNRMALDVALILEECLRTRETRNPDELERPSLDTRLEVLRDLQRLIFEWIDRPIQIQDLADELSISVPHLRFLFHREFGFSLGKHVREVKMGRASNLLVTTDMRVSEIAQRCGYDTVYAFSRAFKTSRAMSPTAYRESHRE